MDLKRYSFLLNEWNEQAFGKVIHQFRKIEVSQHSHHGKEYKRIHFWLDDEIYLCASLTIGYPYHQNEGLSVFAGLNIYKNHSWASYYDGALFTKYLKEAKILEAEFSNILDVIESKIKKGNLEEELLVRNFAFKKINEIESQTQVKINNDKSLYQKYEKNA